MLFEFMKLPNQIVIDVPILVAYDEFYGIFVNIGISCHISKTFKHWDSDKSCQQCPSKKKQDEQHN